MTRIQQVRDLAASIRDRRDRGIVPFVPIFTDELVSLIEGVADDLEEAQAAYHRLTEAACREIEVRTCQSTPSPAS